MMMDSALDRSWFVLAASKELTGPPVSRRLLGRNIVLFRGRSGEQVALEDRCPHRGIPLSMGTVEDGTVVCGYHGWRFDGGGSCLELPCASPDEPTPSATVRSYVAREQQGSVWVCLSKEPLGQPPRWPLEDLPGAASNEMVVRFPANVLWVMQNFFDLSHTPFAHPQAKGRPDPRRPDSSLMRARLSETPTGVQCEYAPALSPPANRVEPRRPPPDLMALLVRALRIAGIVPASRPRHVEEYVAPTTVLAREWFSDERQMVQTYACTPEDEGSTRVTIRHAASLPPYSPILAHLGQQHTVSVLAQDIALVEAQATAVGPPGEEPSLSTAADTPSAWLARAFRSHQRGVANDRELRSKEISFYF